MFVAVFLWQLLAKTNLGLLYSKVAEKNEFFAY
jgi:hypothetical protein